MLPLLAACTPEPTPKIPGEPTDTATPAEDSPTDPHEPPWATILSPSPTPP